MSSWKRPWLGLALAIMLAVAFGLITGCGGGETTTTSAGGESTETTQGPSEGDLAEDQTLVINIKEEPPSLDPNLASDTTSVKVINNVFEGLVHIDFDGNPFPGAAESWDVSDDGLTYTFNLRGTDTWTNGDPVTSEDFKNSWLRILDPATAADYAYQLYFINGAEEFNSGSGTAEDVAVDASDPNTLVVTLKAPTPWFIPMMSHQAFFPIPKNTVDQFGDKWTEPGNIVTNGPYTLEAWNHESDVLLKKWPEWREADSVVLENIKMVMIQEETTGVAAFENGEIDIQEDIPVADIDRLKQLPQYKQFPLLGIYYYGYNVKHAPLDKPEVRKALSLGIDRESIVNNVTKAGQVAATGFVPEGMPGFDVINAQATLIKPTADLEAAKQLLADAGYPDGAGLPEIVIYYNTSEGHQAIATAIQEQWKALGVNATLKNMEWKQYLDFVQNNDDVMVYRMGWVADFADAFNFLDVLRGGGGNNYTRWANADFDKGLNDSLNAASDEDGWAIYASMEKAISVDEMPVAPIYWYTNPELVADYVEGYEPNPLGELTNFWTVKILKHE
ncbi:MAG: peptide ABC transporter substrate-binding protein [Thermoleophilia bacterium]|nr:peptide ABC transporter substrate-binding protein [Thermoleophilia bacterium]